jgi:outer membrane lipoprotein-sorting protein
MCREVLRLKCKTARRMMDLLADRQLPDEQRGSLTAHLRLCAACGAEYAQRARFTGILRGLAPPDPGEGYPHALSGAVLRRLQETRGRGRASSLGARVAFLARPKLLAAAAVALVGIVCVVLLRGPSSRTSAFADTLKAMAEVKTAHIFGTLHGMDADAWLSVEHGIRIEYPGRLLIVTPESTWDYDDQANQVTITDADPEAVSRALAELSGTRWLAKASAEADYSVSEATLGGRPAKRIDIGLRPDEPGTATLWIDAETLRIVRMEVSRVSEDGTDLPKDALDIEYDIAVDPALFEFETPAGAKVVDARIGSLQEIIDEAMKAAETTPIHEVMELDAHPSRTESGLSWDYPERREDWMLHGVGSRHEWTSKRGTTVHVRHGQTEWHGYGQHAYVEETDDEVDEASAVSWLANVKQNFPRPDRPNEMDQEERDGKPVVVLTRYFTVEMVRANPAKEVLVFELHPSRFVERSLYYEVEGEWRLGEHSKYEYLDELPEGVFDFEPPPGVVLEDRRSDG